ncbi:MAG: diguanylate cyclase [Phycisphaerales bacterium]|nr:diguanylate cyclase [Phycisphaerales bacterium]
MVAALTVLSVTVTAVVCANAARRSAHLAHVECTLDTALAAMSAEFTPGGDTPPYQWFGRWARGLTVDRHIAAAALIDGDGRIVSMAPDDVASAEKLSAAIAAGANTVRLDDAIGRATVHLCDLADGHRILLLSRSADDWASAILSAWPVWSTALVGMIALIAGVWHAIDQSAVRPIRSLITMTKNPPRDADAEVEMDLIGGDVGRLAHQIIKLVGESRNSRARLGQLKRTMDARVEYQTRQVQSMLKRAEREAWIDPLTKLGNRRLLDDRLDTLIADQRKRGEDLAMIAFDVDHFKKLNDTLGHAAGDELLRFMGELLRGSLRVSDIGLRLGGDEFAVILLGASIEEAAETADRLIKLFGQRASVIQTDPRPAISAGVASLKYHKIEDGAGLSAAADAGLYRAKRAGKSQVGIVPRAMLAPSLAV